MDWRTTAMIGMSLLWAFAYSYACYRTVHAPTGRDAWRYAAKGVLAGVLAFALAMVCEVDALGPVMGVYLVLVGIGFALYELGRVRRAVEQRKG